MSDTDSFIDEVSEEVRRDKLYKLMRKWGWIPISVVVLIVGAAAYSEWSKSRTRTAAEKLGTEILATIQLEEASDRALAYDGILTEGDNTALLSLLEASDALEEGDAARAISVLGLVANDAGLSDTYRHLAQLKIVLIEGNNLAVEDRIARMQAIAAPGAPYRLLAEEQMAIAELSAGNNDAAMQRLVAVLADGEITTGLRRRVSQLIVALGGDLAPGIGQ